MPTSKLCGTPGEGNKALGGIPNIHYFDFQSKGRGQVIRLLWEDAGIAYTDTRYSFEEYPSFKEGQLREWNPLATIPVVELNGKILTQSYAVLRHFARQLGEYDGQGDEEMYWVDAVCDAAADWRTGFVNALFGPNPDTDYPTFKTTKRPAYLQGLNQQLQSHTLSAAGPYVLGGRITYADLVVYQMCHDEGLSKEGRAGLEEYGRLRALVEAVEARGNVRAFLESERYLG